MALENSKEITIEEIQELDKDSYQMVDIRDEVEISHGAIPGAMAVSADSLMPEHLVETAGELFPAEVYISGDNSKGKKLIIYPIAFSLDNSETDFELSIQYKQEAEKICQLLWEN